MQPPPHTPPPNFRFRLCVRACVQDALDAALRMALSVPLPDLLAYRKLAKACFSLLEVLASGHAGGVGWGWWGCG